MKNEIKENIERILNLRWFFWSLAAILIGSVPWILPTLFEKKDQYGFTGTIICIAIIIVLFFCSNELKKTQRFLENKLKKGMIT